MSQPKKKNPFMDLTYIEEVNRRNNKDFALFTNYQVNPYTKRTLDFVTPKVNERIPKINAECVPGYDVIREAIRKAYSGPMERFCEPQTEQHRLGWFEKGQGYFDRENYDDRFKFSHRTADFIATQAMIKEYDRLMGAFNPKTSNSPKPKPAEKSNPPPESNPPPPENSKSKVQQ